MIRFVIAVAFALLFISCSNRSKNELEIFRASVEGFDQSNKAIKYANDEIYNSLKEQLNERRNAERARIWNPKAEAIKEVSGKMVNYIHTLKQLLIAEAGGASDKGGYHEDNIGVVDRMFGSKGKAKELFGRLLSYKEEILAIDSSLSKELKDHLVIISNDFDMSRGDKSFFDQYFNGLPAIAAMVMLSRFENNVRVIENSSSGFCYSRIGMLDGGHYDQFSPIIAVNSTFVYPGQPIEVTAGIGRISLESQPIITINGVSTATNDNGVAVHRFTPTKVGTHTLHVEISFLKPDGTRSVDTKDITYIVGQPQQ